MSTRKILFVDRDGCVIDEPEDFQIDRFEKFALLPGVIAALSRCVSAGYEIVMVTNQDGLGTEAFPEDIFWPVQNFVVRAFENEGVIFSETFIDPTFPHENKLTRKPGTEMLTKFFDSEKYDLTNSFVIGDRLTDVELAKNLGCRAFWLNYHEQLEHSEETTPNDDLKNVIAQYYQAHKKCSSFERSHFLR